MLLNPKLYEINTRVWIKQFEKGTTLSKIPIKIFEDLAGKGIDIIWLLGIWKTCPELIDKCCFSADLISSYNKALPDWSKEDVIGSPFAIDDYEVNPTLGSISDLKIFKKALNELGIKLVLDFIPNHFGAESKLIKSNPEIFIQADKELLSNDPYTFFETKSGNENIFAHGRDPLFPAWTDTIQVNYFSDSAREFMINKLLRMTELCDGVRCDMAMLQLNNVFENTWLGVLNKKNFQKPKDEFWKTAIEKVKTKAPDFIFLAEVYWDLEWNLQQLGFDFTYDKILTDRLFANDVSGVKAHLMAENQFQMHSVRFLENHDEQRAVDKFGKKQSLAASVLMSTIQGMKLFYDGQFEGKKIKLPVQLGRFPNEKISKSVEKHYVKIFSIIKSEIFRKGEWKYLDPIPVSNNNNSFENIFAWEWKLNVESRLIVINYSDYTSQCRLKLNLATTEKEIKLIDLLNDVEYLRSVEEIKKIGLFIELKNYRSHIFSYIEKIIS
ncbi:MAG: alpha-amylase family glycosyl hydrolase [Bacteroidetes bacterium]|nr:alpha-amylase family glycosyl hydrolase [Bacteroidota bacterium]